MHRGTSRLQRTPTWSPAWTTLATQTIVGNYSHAKERWELRNPWSSSFQFDPKQWDYHCQKKPMHTPVHTRNESEIIQNNNEKPKKINPAHTLGTIFQKLTGISWPRKNIWLCGSLKFSTDTNDPRLSSGWKKNNILWVKIAIHPS